MSLGQNDQGLLEDDSMDADDEIQGMVIPGSFGMHGSTPAALDCC